MLEYTQPQCNKQESCLPLSVVVFQAFGKSGRDTVVVIYVVVVDIAVIVDVVRVVIVISIRVSQPPVI